MADTDETSWAEVVGHPGLFRGLLDYKGKGARCKLESSHSRQHNLHHHVSVGDSSQF